MLSPLFLFHRKEERRKFMAYYRPDTSRCSPGGSSSTKWYDLRIVLNPDSTGYYKGTVTRHGTNISKELDFGLCTAGTEYYQSCTFTGLSANTEYTFDGTLSVKWSESDSYQTGSATFNYVGVTLPATPSNISASVSQDGNTVTVNWYQDYGNGGSTIGDRVTIYDSNDNAIGTKTVTVTSSGTKSCTFDMSGKPSGVYKAEVVAGLYGNEESYFFSDDTTFTIAEPEPDITGTISNVKVTPSNTSATVEWRWTPGVSFRNSSYFYNYNVGYKKSSSSPLSFKYVESSSPTSGADTPKNYIITIPNLTSGTEYDYTIQMTGYKSGDEKLIANTDVASFTTTGTDILSTPSVSVTENTATISWTFTPGSSTTNWYCGFVEIGKGAVFRGVDEQTSAIKQGNNGKMTFLVTFTGLSSGQKYSYGLQMRSGTSNSSSAMYDMSGSEFFKTGNFTTSGTASGDGEYGGTLSNINANPGDTYVEPSFKFTPTSAETHYYRARFYIPAKGANLTSVKTGSSSSPISFTMVDFDRAFDGLTPGNTYSYSIIMYGGPDENSLDVNNVRYDGTFTTSSGSSSGGGSSDTEPSGANSDPSGPSGTADDWSTIGGNGHLLARGDRNKRINDTVADYLGDAHTTSGTATDSISARGEIYWPNTESSSIFMAARLYYAKDNMVSNTHYIGYSDGTLGEIHPGDNSEYNYRTTLVESTISNVKPDETYYIKAYALTEEDIYNYTESTLELNTSYYSNVHKISRVRPYVEWTDGNGGSVTSPRANTLYTSFTVNKVNLNGLGDYFKFVLIQEKGSGSSPISSLSAVKSSSTQTVLYEGSSKTLTSTSDTLVVSDYASNISSGTYNLYACVYYFDSDDGDWHLAGSKKYGTAGTDTYHYGEAFTLHNSINVSGPSQWDNTDPDPGTTTGTPTGLWSASPSAYQKTGTKKVNYSATVSRNDSVQSSYYVRIRVVDTGTGSDIGTTDPQYISRAGSISISRTTSSDLSNGSHSYQFVPEYSASQSGPWTELRSSSGGALKQIVTFVITDGGGGGSSMPSNRIPLWSWDKQNNEHATQQQIRQAYIAISSQGAPSYFLHQVWNSLLYFIEDKIELFGKSWWGSSHGDKYLDFTNALMTKDDRVLTAKRFMTLTYNILNISASAGISFTKPYYSVERRPNETVYGAYFINATNAINDIIAQINANL